MSAISRERFSNEIIVKDEKVDLYGYLVDLYRRRWIVLAAGCFLGLFFGEAFAADGMAWDRLKPVPPNRA